MRKLLQRIFSAYREIPVSVAPSPLPQPQEEASTWNTQVWTASHAKEWKNFLASATGIALLARLRHIEADNNERACGIQHNLNREFVSGHAFGRKCVREDLITMSLLEEDEVTPTLNDDEVERRIKARVNFYRNFNEDTPLT